MIREYNILYSRLFLTHLHNELSFNGKPSPNNPRPYTLIRTEMFSQNYCSKIMSMKLIRYDAEHTKVFIKLA